MVGVEICLGKMEMDKESRCIKMGKIICFGKSGLPNSGQRSARNHYLCCKKFRHPPEIVSESQHILILCGNWWMRQTAAMWCNRGQFGVGRPRMLWSEAA